MPLAKIHFVEGRYDETRIAKVSGAIQAALMNTLRVPSEDFYQLIFELPKNHFLHTPSFASRCRGRVPQTPTASRGGPARIQAEATGMK